MTVVILIMGLAAKLLGNRRVPGIGTIPAKQKAKRAENPIEVISRTALGRSQAVAIVRVSGKSLVVGITEQNVTLLAEVDEVEPVVKSAGEILQSFDIQGTDVVIDEQSSGPSGKGLLSHVREATVRKN